MKLKSLLSAVLACSGIYAASVAAQTGELIASPSYIKPGCTNWEYKEGGDVGNPNDPSHRYEIYAFACDGRYVASKTLVYRQPYPTTCNIALVNSTSYRLSSSACGSFEVRVVGPLPTPAAPTSATISRYGFCGVTPPGTVCPGRAFRIVWPAVQYASYYVYQLSGSQSTSGSTVNNYVDIPLSTTPPAAQVKACNASNVCSGWTIALYQ